MNYASPKLSLDPSRETVAFRALEAVLRDDPTLKRVIRTWSTQRGEPVDCVDPNVSQCPFLAITCRPGPSDRETENLHKFPVLVVVTLAVAGGDLDQLMNLWGALRAAIFPQDADRAEKVCERLREARIMKPALKQAAYLIGQDKEAKSAILVAKGFVEFKLLIPT